MNNKQLLIFQPTIGAYRTDLYNIMSKYFDVSIYIEYKSSDYEIFDSEKTNNRLVTRPNLLKKFLKIGRRQLYRGYWDAIRTTKPNLVLVSEFGLDAISAIVYRALFRKRYKIVSICDDSYQMLSQNWDFSKAHKRLRKIVVPLIDDLILVEPSACEWYRKYYDKGLYFPIISDEERMRIEYRQALPKSLGYRNRYGLKGKFIYLYVGRLVEIKNVKTLISAFNKISHPDVKLIIVGNGEQERELKLLAAKDKDIVFTGRLFGDNLNAWYNLANVLVLPSLVEPFGAVTNEALVGGCKVLVSSYAGSRCLVREGINGYTFNPMDERDLIEKMEKLYSHTATALSEKIHLRDSLMSDSYEDHTRNLMTSLLRL